MQARCPHCQSVFGTDRTGIQFCPNCGQQINVPGPDQAPSGFVPPEPSPPAIGPGGEPGAAGSGAREATPWERRSELGGFKGLFETWKQAMFSPERFFSKVRPDGSWMDALLYAWILSAVSAVLQAPFQMLQLGVNTRTMKTEGMPPELQRFMELFQANSGKMVLFGVVGGVLLYPLALFVGSALIHLFCLMFGCSRNGYMATFRALAYSSSPTLIAVVPCIGGCFAAVYTIVLEIIAVAKLQDSTYGRAAAAVLGIIVVALCCVCGLLIAAGMMGAAAVGAH